MVLILGSSGPLKTRGSKHFLLTCFQLTEKDQPASPNVHILVLQLDINSVCERRHSSTSVRNQSASRLFSIPGDLLSDSGHGNGPCPPPLRLMAVKCVVG